MLRLCQLMPLLAAVGILPALSLTAPAQTADALTVQVSGGKTFTGFVDSQTDERQLWLRRELGTAVLGRPISWERIVAASRDGQRIELSDLPQLARQIASSRQVVVQPRPAAPAALPPIAPQRPIAALAIDAAIANWDADVESDGLVIELSLIDDDGSLAAASGSLEVELFAPRIRKYHEAPQSRGYFVDLIERWTVPLTAQQFRGGTARVRLPFGAIHPEFDRGVDAQGLVHARLAVPGQGVFEHSVDGVSLRNFAPVRDALLDNTGRSFLPTEMTGRGEGAYPLPRW